MASKSTRETLKLATRTRAELCNYVYQFYELAEEHRLDANKSKAQATQLRVENEKLRERLSESSERLESFELERAELKQAAGTKYKTLLSIVLVLVIVWMIVVYNKGSLCGIG